MMSNHTLIIEFEGQTVGELVLDPNTDQLHLNYDTQWKSNNFALSPHLPLDQELRSINVQRFIRNLFPEGNSFEVLLESYRVSKNNTFGLIRILGHDTASGLVFKSSNNTIATSFRPLPSDELIERLSQREQHGLVVWDEKPRLSVAGVQDKINVVVKPNGELGFGEGELRSTHILKFEQKRHAHIVLNEYMMMHLATLIGLPVAEVSLKRFDSSPALLVKRFDRHWISDHKTQCRYVIDGCQALNLPPEYKYERNFGSGRDVKHIREGASLPKLFALTDYSPQPALDKQKLLDQVLFNLCINNFDAHGKNFSFFVASKGLTLTPAYDLVSIAIYPQFDQELAMALGDEFKAQAIHAYQLADFADSCHLPRTLVAKRLQAIASKLLNSLTIATQAFYDLALNQSEQDFIAALLELISKQCKYFIAESDAIVSIKL
ncbi:MAG: HipA domain-containing protein [Thiofilum sp.]|uniref:HipA domain-containing protein n=1 Tax=Thiofilum sp. TaxID=2212733 RepID=UPI0025EA0491|nr:HipA domain-containing protein [Thiofilum sp.]MBK8453389.1 HipA domain-containing protein [Thiofilum sp.]